MARALYRSRFGRGPTDESEGPAGWSVRQLGDLAESRMASMPKGKLYEPTSYVGLEHIPRRSLALNAWDTVTQLGSNKLRFCRGDVLFGKIRPYFHKVSIAPFSGTCSADTIVMRSKSEDYWGVVAGLVSSDEFVAHASATSNGSKMPRANWRVLREYPVYVPPPDLARRFTEQFRSITDLQMVLVAQVHNLRQTRDLLLPRLMSGELQLKTD
jgi:type I restriction enzyme S subunit